MYIRKSSSLQPILKEPRQDWPLNLSPKIVPDHANTKKLCVPPTETEGNAARYGKAGRPSGGGAVFDNDDDAPQRTME